MKMPFGKHRGEEVEDLETGYIVWVLENCEGLDERLQEELEAQLSMRRGEGAVRRSSLG